MEPRDLSKRKGWTDWGADFGFECWSYGPSMDGWVVEQHYRGYKVKKPLRANNTHTGGDVFPTLQAAVMYVEIEVSNGN